MSGLHMPPAEPPAQQVREVTELLELARQLRADSYARAHRAHELDHDYLDRAGRMKLRVLMTTRHREAELWDAEVAALEAEARALGLQP